jgi:hypothetical protein
MKVTCRERLGDKEYRRRIEVAKKELRDKRRLDYLFNGDPERDRIDREIARQFNEDVPGGCERCGEPFGIENAEVVTDDDVHLIVHVECMGDDKLA